MKRTYEQEVSKFVCANDLEEIVRDKRSLWRANSRKARRRQRRYKNRIAQYLVNNLYS